MRVLFLCPWLPWPLNSGGKIRTYHLLRAASASAEVHLRAVLEPGQSLEAAPEVEAACASVRVFERGSAGPVQRWSRPKLERWFHSPVLRNVVRGELAEGGWDLVHLDELLLARVPDPLARVPVLQHHHKIDTVLYETTTAHKGAHRHFDLWKLRRLEALAARRFPHHLVCGEGDRDVLLERYPGLDVDVLPSGYDPAYFQPSEPAPARERDHLLFLGSMAYEPNVDAVVRFVHEAFDQVCERRPDVRLSIVGRDPAPEVRALAGDRIEVTGEVPDVRPWLERASALIVPLRIGGGTRLKIVEALGLGCPVVSTTIGAEGLGLVGGEEVALADDFPGFAQRSIELLEDPERAAELGRRGRARVREHFGWERLGARLVEIWERAAAGHGTP